MSERVVDAFKAIEIEEKDCEALASFGQLQCLFEALIQKHSIWQIC